MHKPLVTLTRVLVDGGDGQAAFLWGVVQISDGKAEVICAYECAGMAAAGLKALSDPRLPSMIRV